MSKLLLFHFPFFQHKIQIRRWRFRIVLNIIFHNPKNSQLDLLLVVTHFILFHVFLTFTKILLTDRAIQLWLSCISEKRKLVWYVFFDECICVNKWKLFSPRLKIFIYYQISKSLKRYYIDWKAKIVGLSERMEGCGNIIYVKSCWHQKT